MPSPKLLAILITTGQSEDLLPVLFKYAPLFSSLTNLYIEIYYNQGEEDLDFFLLPKDDLTPHVELPEDFKSAVKIVCYL